MPMRCGRGIHNGGFRLHPGSNHLSTHGTGGNADTRIAAYAFHLPSIRQGVDIQDSLLFSPPPRSPHSSAIPFETLQVQILSTRKGGKALARRGNIFLLNAVGTFSCTIVPGMWRPSVQYTAIGERYGRENRDESFHTPVGSADADGRQCCRCVA